MLLWLKNLVPVSACKTKYQINPWQAVLLLNLASDIFVSYKRNEGGILICGEPNYTESSSTFQSILKPNVDTAKLDLPNCIPPTNPVSELELNDVKKLLTKHFGQGWKQKDDLSFYRSIHALPTQSLQKSKTMPKRWE